MCLAFSVCMVFSILTENQEVLSFLLMSAFTSALMILLSYAPAIISRRMRIVLPVGLQMAMVIFILLAQFFGEILRFYDRIWWWDIMLHGSSGFMLGIVGVLVVYSLNEAIVEKIHPATIMLFAFCFAMTAGAIWELFEFIADYLLGMNMQKSVFTYSEKQTAAFNSEAIKYFNENVKFFSRLGESKTGRVFDAGLVNTMVDFIANTVGALISVISITFYMKNNRKDKK